MVALVVAAAVVVAGCGGDDDTPASDEPTTSEAPDDPTTTEQAEQMDAADSRADADAAVLQLDDVPSGWAEQPEEARPDFEATWQDLVQCAGVDDPSADEIARAESPTFVSPPATQASSTVVYLEGEEQADELTKALTADDALACAEQAFAADVERNAPEGAAAGEVEVEPLELDQRGDITIAYRTRASVEIGEATIPLVMDFVAVFDGDAVSRLTFLNVGGPFPDDLRESLVDTVVSRV
jgi:hypothetical protein